MADDTSQAPRSGRSRSPGHRTVYEALHAVMVEVTQVGKLQQNTESPDRFMFRGVDAVVNAVGPAFRKHRVLCFPRLLSATTRDLEMAGGTAAREVTVKVRYRFFGPQGDHEDVVVPGEAVDYGDKAVTKAMSVAWRTALIQALAIPTGDPDPDSASYRRQQQDRAADGTQAASRPVDGARRPSGAGQAAQEPQRDPRQSLWDDIIARGATIGLDLARVKGHFRRWSGGVEINASDTTPELLTRYYHAMERFAREYEAEVGMAAAKDEHVGEQPEADAARAEEVAGGEG